VVVIIGPSGSGKSTFLRCLNGLEAFDDGQVIIDGVDLGDSKTNINTVRREVGMVFQHFNLFPHKTVLENVTLAQRVVRKRKAAEAETQSHGLTDQSRYRRKSALSTLPACRAANNSGSPSPARWRWTPR
jgi:polar amino acid transport system ATP-binding protein